MSRKKTNGKRPGVIIYYEVFSALEDFNDGQYRRMFEAIFNYAKDKILPTFDKYQEPGLYYCWKFIQPKIDADEKHYEEVCANRSHNRGGENKAPPASDNDDEDPEDDFFDLPS